MKKLLHIASFLLLLALGTLSQSCDRGEDVLEPVRPKIQGQSILAGTKDVSIGLEQIIILFDLEVEVGDERVITLWPDTPLTVEAKDRTLRIAPTEQLLYETDYVLTIGEGAVKEKVTGGKNEERSINFTTEKAPYTPPTEPTMRLVTDDALPVAQSLYTYLWSIYGHQTLSGVMANVEWKALEAEWVKKWAGGYPAVCTFSYNYLHRSPSQNLNYSDVSPVVGWWAEGGLVAADWYWMVPTAEGSRQYVTERDKTTVRAKNMLTEGTWENDLLKADLKEMADMLLLLQAEEIPVLWRPLPEASGNIYTQSGGRATYWWGDGTPDEFRALWHTMFDYFEERGVRNLIWVWTTQTGDLDYYPGEEWVDIISCDVYDRKSPTSVAALWRHVDHYFPHKMIALSELGSVANIPLQLDEGICWSYFVAKDDLLNDFTEGFAHANATVEWWRQTLADDRVLTRDELPRIRSAVQNCW